MNRLFMGALLAATLSSPALAQTETEISSISVSRVAISTPTAEPIGLSTGSVSSSTPMVSPLAPAESPSPAPPWVIGEISVSGNKNVKASVIRGQSKVRKGDLYDRPDLDRDIQALLGLGNFERVAADISSTGQPVPEHLRKVSGSSNTIKLTFLVSEKPVIKKIKFEGQKKISKGTLTDLLSLKAKDPFDPLKLSEDRDKMLAKYEEKGYLNTKIDPVIDKDTSTLQANITFKIQEGPKSTIGMVNLHGVSAFKPKKVLKQMKNRRKKPFAERELKEDLDKIKNFYLNRGYLDIQVSSPTVAFSEDKTKVTIDITLNEGRSYRFGDTSFSGHMVYVSSELAKAIEYRKGKIFNQERFDETIRGIQELYAEKGRLHARVSPVKTFNQETDLMDVHFGVMEGDIVYIDHVDVEGNKATKTHVLRREIVVKQGQIFQASRVRKSRERIINLGFIDDVELDIQPSPTDQDKVDLTFDVVEGKPGMLTLGAAFSSLDGLIGTLSLSHLNLFGRAQRASVQWSFGKRVQDYSISWTTPWVANRPVSLGFDLFNTRRISPFQSSINAYVQRNRGGTVRVGPRFEEDKYQLNLSYTFSQIRVGNVQDQFKGTLSEGTSIFSAATVEFARDTRDNIWDPSHGSRNGLAMELSGGPFQGDIHFFKPSLTNSVHYKLFSVAEWPLVLSLANRAAYITQFNETRVVPVFNRFFVGGQDTLRGYAPTGEVGYPSGGKVMEVFTAELGFPLARERRRTIVKLVGFFDMGTAWDNMRSAHLRIGSGERDLKTDVGIGIRFTTPAFPIRLDWAYGFNHRPGEKQYQINFGLGPLF
ncbi:MAG: outer membrane protein assembly factor BamA [Elusimicrobia bacterium]|nr:outer membrane protein assembly factor BamA [Elusimicrobiota bacterium]